MKYIVCDWVGFEKNVGYHAYEKYSEAKEYMDYVAKESAERNLSFSVKLFVCNEYESIEGERK